jgi:hypothetical protein
MSVFRFYFAHEGIEGHVSCHASTRGDAEAIFNLMGLHEGLGYVE